MGDHVAVGMPGEPARVIDRDTRRARAALPAAKACASTPEADAKLTCHASEASASGNAARSSTRKRGLPRRVLEAPPGPAANVDGHEPGGGGRKHVVVDPVTDVGDLARRTPAELDDVGRRSAGSGFLTPEVADEEITSAGSAASLAHRSSALVWLPTMPTRARAPGDARGTRSRPGRGRELVRQLVHHVVGSLDPEVPPELVVLLAARDRDAERRPDHVRLQTRSLGEEPPPSLLVDERLADVEEDGSQSHDSTSCEIGRRRDLQQPNVTVDDTDPPTARLDERRAIRRVDGPEPR